MRRLYVIGLLAPFVVLASGCPRKPTEAEKKQAAPAEPTAAPGAMAPDTESATGAVPVAVMEVQTKLDVPGLAAEGKLDEEVQKAQAASATTQILVVSEARGKLVFTTPGSYVPRGSELRYHPGQKKYVLVDPEKKQYWAFSGNEIGGLLEGGPAMSRSNYAVSVTDTKEKETIAGLEAIRSDGELSFDWSVKTKSAEKKGRVKVKLAIWHSADPKLKPAWGKMMLDFLSVPFQDEGGQRAIEQLKSKINFPLKWAMEVENEAQPKTKGEARPKLLTVAQRLEIKELPRAELAAPPLGCQAAAAPYEFGEGGQTVRAEVLAKIPAKEGAPEGEQNSKKNPGGAQP